MAEEGAMPGRREQAKEERRARIVAAAHDLMSEIGFEEMSMKELAIRASVSPATVYNLFESKDAVVMRVFAESFDRYREIVIRKRSKDPLQHLFDALDIACDIYAADPEFYRSSVWLGRGSSLAHTILEPRVRFWGELVSEIAEAGQIKGVDPSVLGACCVVPLFSAAYQAWAASETNIDEFRAQTKYGFAVALKAFAPPAERERLDKMVQTLERKLLKHANAHGRSQV
jgi:AcrR family transcriptional regulator